MIAYVTGAAGFVGSRLARALLAPAAARGLATYPVSTEVNSVRNNGPELMQAVPAPIAPGAALWSDKD